MVYAYSLHWKEILPTTKAARKHWPVVSGWTPVLSTKPSSKEILRRVWSAKKKKTKRYKQRQKQLLSESRIRTTMCINFSCGSIFLTNKNTLSLATLGSIFLLWTSFVWCQKLLSHCRRAEFIFSKTWLWLWCLFVCFFLSFFRSFVLSFFRSFVLSFFRSFVLSFFRSFFLSFFLYLIRSDLIRSDRI